MPLPPARPILCLVTPACAPQNVEDATRRIRERTRAAMRAGIDLVQIRGTGLPARALAALVRVLVRDSRGTPTRVIVSDRLDVACAAGADGVHLRADSFGAALVRAMWRPASPHPGFGQAAGAAGGDAVSLLVGRSVHGAEEAARVCAAGGIDYLVFGTVFASASKPPGTTPAGLDRLREVVKAATVPVLAIGGVTTDRMPDLARAGAAGIAAISLFDRTDADLADLVRRVRAAFDTPGRVA